MDQANEETGDPVKSASPPQTEVAPLDRAPTSDTAAPRVHGTILIPAGLSRLPEDLRPSTTSAQVDEAAPDCAPRDAEPESTIPSAVEFLGRPQTSSLPPAVLAAAAARAAQPQVQAMHVAASLDPHLRQQEVAARRGRRRTMMFVGSLVAGIVVLAATLVIVLVNHGDTKADAEKQFLAAHQVALETTAAVNDDIVDQMVSVTKGPKPSPAELKSVVEAGKAKVGSLSLPVATGTYAPASDRLARAVKAETAFLEGLSALTSKGLVELSAGDLEVIGSLWAETTVALGATYNDARTAAPPSWDQRSASIVEFGRAVTASADLARANAAELAALELYRAEVTSLLDRYETLRTQLGDYEARKKYVYTIGDSASVRAVFEDASNARYELATRLGGVDPPSALATTHQAMVNTIRRLAGEVSDAADAAGEAYCRTDSYYYRGAVCAPIGDTLTYNRYLTVANAISDEFALMKSTWLSLQGQEASRLS